MVVLVWPAVQGNGGYCRRCENTVQFGRLGATIAGRAKGLGWLD